MTNGTETDMKERSYNELKKGDIVLLGHTLAKVQRVTKFLIIVNGFRFSRVDGRSASPDFRLNLTIPSDYEIEVRQNSSIKINKLNKIRSILTVYPAEDVISMYDNLDKGFIASDKAIKEAISFTLSYCQRSGTELTTEDVFSKYFAKYSNN